MGVVGLEAFVWSVIDDRPGIDRPGTRSETGMRSGGGNERLAVIGTGPIQSLGASALRVSRRNPVSRSMEYNS